MENYNNILVKLWIEGFIVTAIPLGLIIGVFIEKKNENNKVKFRVRSIKEIEKVVWICLIPMSILFYSGVPNFMDCSIKDFQQGQGVFQQLNGNPKSLFTDKIVIDKQRYDIPKNMRAGRENEGKECTFKYTKRTRVILEINFDDK